MKKAYIILVTLLLSFILMLTGCTGKPAGTTKQGDLSGKRIALIMQLNLGTFSAQYIAGVKEQVEKFGGKVTVLASDGDLGKMAANLDAAVNQHFDGILIDHGTPEALQNGIQKAVDKKIPVV
ncbi:MAG TPA: LacI family transcriptional regulator, partial [Paenibacillaceae bacterium]|nr:LacI family transcriptional regulator [Paenibacillaceae bacterium]